jgi:hypothetical protein
MARIEQTRAGAQRAPRRHHRGHLCLALPRDQRLRAENRAHRPKSGKDTGLSRQAPPQHFGSGLLLKATNMRIHIDAHMSLSFVSQAINRR